MHFRLVTCYSARGQRDGGARKLNHHGIASFRILTMETIAVTEPRRFILQALDPDHGSPVLEALFRVSQLEDLRPLVGGACGKDDSNLEGHYNLQANELAAITSRFGVLFNPERRETCLCSWDWWREIPYLSHNGYELPLLLEGRKPFARMSDAYPPDRHFDEDRFDRYVAQGLIHKEVVVEPFAKPHHVNGRVYEGQRIVYYARKGEEWRIPASKVIWSAAKKTRWSDDFERMEVMLFGYEDWQCDWWIAHRGARRGEALDELIESVAGPQWQKVAMIVARTLRTYRYLELAPETVGARVEALVAKGRLQVRGDLSSWRHSEVRLPDTGDLSTRSAT
jgi:hypothetical protein